MLTILTLLFLTLDNAIDMVNINENIRFLRKQKGLTQEQFAEKVGIKRSVVGAYEEGRASPPLETLLKMAELFQITADDFISKNLSKGEVASPIGTGGNSPQFKVLSITVDKDDNENIELVPQKASAGYLNGFADPEYIEELPRFQLPVLPKNATYRAFEISGDSMLPLESGTIIIGQYLESSDHIKNGKTYVLVTSKEGVVYKRVFNYLKDNGKLYLVSDNAVYTPYEIQGSDVLEIWEAKAFISFKFPDDGKSSELSLEKLTQIVLELQQEVVKLKDR
ncbi:MAG: LexA family transcriptional regulator [Imperialibacter sp.]|uniref:XRE family transcriptional regulator n=1 Tax=Imperialibacter sp. TaxID=2038411 RepID=UPI0032ED6FAF